MKDTNIVDSIAACVDKYTYNSVKSKSSTRPLPTISKDLTQPLTVLTSNEKDSSSSSTSFRSEFLNIPAKLFYISRIN